MVPEVLLVQEVPSGEVRMVPEVPTPTINTLVVELSVVVVVDLLLLQEMMVKLKRRKESRMSKCFIGFLISDLGEHNIYHQSVCFTRMWDFTWRVD